MERAGFVHSLIDHRTAEAPPPTSPLQEESLPQDKGSPVHPETGKRYSRTRLIIGLGHSLLVFSFTIAVLATGLSVRMEELAGSLASNRYLVLLGFAGLFGLSQAFFTLPLRYFSGYVLEHRYGLSNQTRGKWLWEGIKGMLVGIPLMVPILLALYFCLRNFSSLWWIPAGTAVFFFSVLLARLAPVLIFPLFYKFRPLEEGDLKNRIVALCQKVGMKVSGVFVFNMSKNTKKANAAFTGVGKSKRIILGDTLVANFTDDEIETVFAHELGHFKLRHIWLMMVIGAVSTFVGLFLTSVLYETSLTWFGFASIDTIAALPLLGLWLGLYSLVTAPLSNMISRAHERAADLYAIQTTGKKTDFVNALLKLSRVNLSDASPHPLVEFFFYSHPSIEKRVRAVEEL